MQIDDCPLCSYSGRVGRTVKGSIAVARTPVVGRCPACGASMEVRRLRCPRCATAVEGRFALPYAVLTAEQAGFLEVFLRARGNLREVERVLGLSYPTVRSRLDTVLQALGFAEGPAADGAAPAVAPAVASDTPREERLAVLRALEGGEISAAEAACRIRGG